MADRRVLTDEEVRVIVQGEIFNADGITSMSELSAERGLNMDYYQGRPFGTEVEGRSSVVSTDVMETVEWILPSLIRIFASGEDAVEFAPETQSQVADAKLATEYINYIWNNDNKGFLNFYSWFKDALISKNGTVKIWWDTTPRQKRETYYGLDELSYTQLVADEDVTVSEHTENKTKVEVPSPQGPQSQEIVTHDVVITRTIKKGRCCVHPLPPEEFMISRDARSIEDARLVGHARRRPLSDLKEEGFPEDLLADLNTSGSTVAKDSEEIKRDTVENSGGTSGSSDAINEAMRKVWVYECYVRVDMDGDGIAEMRKVTMAGAGYKLLRNEAWDTPRPFADITPILMPHRYHGLAIADVVREIQLIKSTILRQYLDNLYLSNNQREEVVVQNIIDPSEVLSSAPGRKIRVKQAGSVIPIAVPQVGDAALAGLEYLDRIKENRSGVSERTQGLGANALHDTAAGEKMLLTAAMSKIELIARLFAETGVKDAFKLILQLVCRYQDEPRTVKITGQWTAIDPSKWNEDMGLEVHVGMGMGDKELQLQHQLLIGQLQEKAFPLGFVTPQNLYNNAEDVLSAMGKKDAARYFTLPPPGQQQQQKPDPAMAKVQADMQLQTAKQQGQMELQKQKMALDVQEKQQERVAQAAADQHSQQIEAQRHSAEMQMEAALERQRLAMETSLKQMEMSQNAKLEIILAQIRANAQIEAAAIAAKASADVAASAENRADTPA